MPEYLSPGVYVEEVDRGPKPIATAVKAIKMATPPRRAVGLSCHRSTLGLATMFHRYAAARTSGVTITASTKPSATTKTSRMSKAKRDVPQVWELRRA